MIAERDSSPVVTDQLPDEWQWSDELRPDRVEMDFEQLFEARNHDYSSTGMLVTAYDGHLAMYPSPGFGPGDDPIALAAQVEGLDIGAGESLFTDAQMTYRLDHLPFLQVFDDVIRPASLDSIDGGAFNLFPGSNGLTPGQCTLR